MELEVLELRTDHPEQHFKVHFSGLTIRVFSKNIKMHVGITRNTFPGITGDTLSVVLFGPNRSFGTGSGPLLKWVVF